MGGGGEEKNLWGKASKEKVGEEDKGKEHGGKEQPKTQRERDKTAIKRKEDKDGTTDLG